MSEYQSWQNQDSMHLLQQQLLNTPNAPDQVLIPNFANERFLPQNYQLPLEATVQSHFQHLSQFPIYPPQINPFQVGQFLPEQVFSQEHATNYQHGSGLTSLDPAEEKILFGSDDDVSSSIRVTSQGNIMTQDGCCGTLAYINSGSWSALMQDAVEASSSETGLHEEWSGLSFQKSEEPSISNGSCTLTANQPSNFVANDGHTWNLPAVSGSHNLLDLSAQYSSVISENPHLTAIHQMEKGMQELRYQHAFQSNCSDRASINPLATFSCSQHTTHEISRSVLEPNHKAKQIMSSDTAFLDITTLATAESSASHENLQLNQNSFPRQFISNQLIPQFRYPSAHLNPNLPQIAHYNSQSNILDSKRNLCSQNTFLGSLGSTEMANDAINNLHRPVAGSLDFMVNNLWNTLLVRQNPTSIPPTKVTPSMFQSNREQDNCLPGIATSSSILLNQDQKIDPDNKASMLITSSDEAKNMKKISHSTNSISRMMQGSACMKDATLQFQPVPPKRGCRDEPCGLEPRPKRQKADTSKLVSWSKVVGGSCQRLDSTRINEHWWAEASNRQIEKVEDMTKLKGEVSSEALTRKRLILTTKLMWQLLPAVEYEYLKEDATLAYQNITYCVTRSALEESCTLISSFTDSSFLHTSADRILQKLDDKSGGGSTLSEFVQNVMRKSISLESQFIRLDKRSSLVDLTLIWQELERFAIVSCLGKFHTQSRHVNARAAASPQNAPQRHLAQRHATLVIVQTDTSSLNGVPCLSL